MLALVLAVPPYYAHPPRREQPRPLREKFERLEPYKDLIQAHGTQFLVGQYPVDIQYYLGHARCATYGYELLNEWKPGLTLAQFLESRNITLFYLDEHLLQQLSGDPSNPFVGNAGDAHWKLLACGDVPGNRWKLFRRVP